MAGDAEAAARDAAHAEALIRRRPWALIDAAERGNAAAVRLLAELGYDVDARHRHTALHAAAYAGHREVCELLVALGADLGIRDASFDAPAAGWARHAHHDALADWLEAAG
jgi:ankyrin repeat protein